ncbi:HD-GYP domain-containing protein [Oryzifoliimicrobium ureilyticus]|uniref:HD-GYP domain-containing protein n=1 Tax=Oryzifoliimicrobium ureilyticus TaxID=3113724 RepID=UPI0030762320
MRKRIRLNQLRVGMYVEELEDCGKSNGKPGFTSVLVSSQADLERLLNSKVISAVINLRKGIDVEPTSRSEAAQSLNLLRSSLIAKFSREELEEAQRTVDKTLPQIREVFAASSLSGAFPLANAQDAVDTIMVAAKDNAGALTNLLKLKQHDQGTFLHSLGVSALMVTFGRTLELPEETIRELGLAGLVHDIGKTVITLTILNKKGRLSPEEIMIMRKHPQEGYKLLSTVEGVNQTVLDICLYHHEKFDGTGYPERLRGEAIPYYARMAAVCDVYEALTSARSYKLPWSQAEAVNLMERSAGHFDPKILKQFISRMVIAARI